MGLDLTCAIGSEEMMMRFSDVEWEILGTIGKSLPGPVNIIAGVEDFGEPWVCKRATMIEALTGRGVGFATQRIEHMLAIE